MKPSELIKKCDRVDWAQRVVDRLSDGKPVAQSRLRLEVGMTGSKCEKMWPALLDDLAERGLIVVWKDESKDSLGRPAVLVSLTPDNPDL